MRRSHRLALTTALALAGLVSGPGRDVSSPPAPQEQARVPAASAQGPDRARARVVPSSSAAALAARTAGDAGAPRARASLRVVADPRPPEAPPSGAAAPEAAGPEAAGNGGLHWIGVFDSPDQPLVAAAGMDLSAPRELTLWKLDALRRTATPVTRMRSEIGRPFVAEHLLLSVRGARLVAAPRGADPFGPHASQVIEVPPRDVTREKSP